MSAVAGGCGVDRRGAFAVDGARKIVITGEVLLTVAACILVMVGLTLFTSKTRTGKAMRAVSEDRDAA